MKRRKLHVIALILVIIIILQINIQGAANQPTQKLIPTNIPEKFEKVKQDPRFPVVTIWYSVTGKGEQALNNLICWFNATIGKEKKIHVKGVYQGEYDKITNCFLETIDRWYLPDLVQLNSGGASAASYAKPYFMVLEDVLAQENQLSVIENLNPNARASCTYNGKLFGLPFGSEMMGLHYNADAFKAAGLDPANPPKTMAEYAAAAAKLLIKDKTGNVKRYGSAGRLDVRLLSTWIPRMKGGTGAQFSGEEGRLEHNPKYLPVKDGTLKKVLTAWKKLLDTGANDNSVYTNYEIRRQFENGRAAMYMASTVNMEGTRSRFVAEKDKSKKFDARLARLPKLTAEDAPGQTIGGYGLYLIDKKWMERKAEATEFIKFLASVDASAYFAANSGYFPTNTDAMNTAYVQDAQKKNPHRKLSLDLLAEAAGYTKAQEPFVPVGVWYNKAIGEQAMEMANGQPIDTCVTNIAKKANVNALYINVY